MRTFRRLRKAYRRFAKRNRKPILRANKRALGAVWKAIGYLKTGMNVERKYWDRLSLVQSTATDVNPIILATPWDGMIQGTNPNDRIGDQVKALWTSFRTRIEYSPTTLGTGAQCYVRILVVMDTEPRGGSAVTAVGLRDAILAATATGPLQITSPYKVAYTATGAVGGRWKILKDFKMAFDNVKNKNREVEINLNHMRNKYRGFRIKYNSPDIPADDRLYILAVTDSTTADDIQFSGDYSRLCFVDN